MDGKEIQFESVGHANSVDVSYQFPFTIDGGKEKLADIALVGSRETNEMIIFRIDSETGKLYGLMSPIEEGQDKALPRDLLPGRIPVGIKLYGSCDYRSPIT